ncbi:MAG: SIS domain-containing protein [Flavobacteriales bacterium]|nr:SIS domain-containing protein [Flavobacteriales bacterium]MDW8410984.1 SIS domain-containing protein [Flavobacteriales bacterium]
MMDGKKNINIQNNGLENDPLIYHQNYLDLLRNTLSRVNINILESIKKEFLACYEREGTFYIFGNGGSGSTASHIAGDFVKGASSGLKKRFRFVCLNDNVPAVMAIANDHSYEDIFLEQLKNFLRKGDLVIGISGSGNSMNVLKAIEYAKIQKVKTVGFCGYKGGKLKELADICFHVEVMDMEITEDIHLMAFHSIKQALIRDLNQGQWVSMGAAYDERIK